jgi:flavin-dependent dehydrogenase
MRKVAIIGAGQSGLQLALGLQQNQYEVTLVSNRTAEQILCGRVTSSQFMFHDSLQNERDLVINFWEEKCPITEGIAFTIPGPDKTKALFWEAKLDHYGFNYPPDYSPWWFDPAEASNLIKRIAVTAD